jgi:hypothetical protein
MDIKKYFFIAITFLIVELLISLYMLQASQNSDPAGKAMGQGLGQLGLLLAGTLTFLLIICFTAQLKWAVTTITYLASLPFVILVLFQTKDFIDRQLNGWQRQSFEQGTGLFPTGEPTKLAKAIAANDTAQIISLVSQGVNLNQAGVEVESYLHYAIQLACEYNHPLLPLHTLLQAGADPNFNTPLVKAYESLGENSLQAMKMLLEKGADPNAQDMYKQAILLTCTDVEKLKLLVAYGADINIKSTYWTSKGYTPVMSLMDKDAWESILFLLEKGADIDHQAEDGSTLKEMMRRRRYTYESSLTSIPPLFENLEEKIGISGKVKQ